MPRRITVANVAIISVLCVRGSASQPARCFGEKKQANHISTDLFQLIVVADNLVSPLMPKSPPPIRRLSFLPSTSLKVDAWRASLNGDKFNRSSDFLSCGMQGVSDIKRCDIIANRTK